MRPQAWGFFDECRRAVPRHELRGGTPMSAVGLPTLKWTKAEIAFWLVPVAAFFLFPHYLTLGSQVLIAGLFALSLDLILGYARIISLGHAAFFGLGAYTAGLLARHGYGEPLSGLVLAAAIAALAGWITSFLIVRGQDLTRLMVTLGIGLMLFEAANQASSITGGVDGLSGVEMRPIFGAFASGIAGIAGALLAQTTQFVGIDTLGFPRSAELMIMLVLGGTGYLYGALIGATVFMLLQDFLSNLSAVYWQFWLGLLLIVIVLFARGGLMGGIIAFRRAWKE